MGCCCCYSSNQVIRDTHGVAGAAVASLDNAGATGFGAAAGGPAVGDEAVFSVDPNTLDVDRVLRRRFGGGIAGMFYNAINRENNNNNNHNNNRYVLSHTHSLRRNIALSQLMLITNDQLTTRPSSVYELCRGGMPRGLNQRRAPVVRQCLLQSL